MCNIPYYTADKEGHSVHFWTIVHAARQYDSTSDSPTCAPRISAQKGIQACSRWKLTRTTQPTLSFEWRFERQCALETKDNSQDELSAETAQGTLRLGKVRTAFVNAH